MKVIKYIFILVALFSCFMVTEAMAEYQDKSMQKESKKAATRLEKEGWKVFGNVKSIKEGMDAHYKALFEGKGRLTTIEAHGIAKDINAAAQYAAMRESKVEGETETKVSSTSDGETSSGNVELTTHFRSSTDQLVKSMKPSVVFYRTMSDGKYEVRAFYLVSVL